MLVDKVLGGRLDEMRFQGEVLDEINLLKGLIDELRLLGGRRVFVRVCVGVLGGP